MLNGKQLENFSLTFYVFSDCYTVFIAVLNQYKLIAIPTSNSDVYILYMNQGTEHKEQVIKYYTNIGNIKMLIFWTAGLARFS